MTPSITKVVVIEPSKTGYSHAIFNASLLAALRNAFPTLPICFYGEPDHSNWVRTSLQSTPDFSNKIEFSTLPLPDLAVSRWRRLQREWRYHVSLMRRFAEKDALLVYASVTPTAILALKLASLATRNLGVTLAVVHCLQELLKPATKISEIPFDLRHILTIPHSRNLKLIALGKPLVAEAELLAGRKIACESIDIPRIRNTSIQQCKNVRPTFAFVGGTAKGFDIFQALSREFHNHPRKPRFLLAGYVNSILPEDIHTFVEGISKAPITQRELELRLQSADYAIWTANAETYRLTASATFADAISLGIPVIALKNSFVNYYFTTVGEAGVLCDDAVEMTQEVRRLLENWPGSAEVRFLNAAKLLSQRFDPQNVGNSIVQILERNRQN